MAFLLFRDGKKRNEETACFLLSIESVIIRLGNGFCVWRCHVSFLPFFFTVLSLVKDCPTSRLLVFHTMPYTSFIFYCFSHLLNMKNVATKYTFQLRGSSLNFDWGDSLPTNSY